jgi:uncharacterized membrane protein
MTAKKDQEPILLPARFIASLLVLPVISVFLLVVRAMASDSSRYLFLPWNLFLAAVPLLLAWWLVWRVRVFGWLMWQQVLLTLGWLAFLPNSFYLMTDFIHLRPNHEADLLFDIVLLTSFMLSGLILGVISVYMVHVEIRKRLSERYSYGVIGLVFLACSFAICLGRYTRWNTWDILLQPAGLLFDVSDRLINPGLHAQTYQTTVTLFLVLFGAYVALWEGARLLRRQ